MEQHFFDGLDGMPRPQKPRDHGLTMVVDWGLGLRAQEDLITSVGPYMDFAKLAVGVSRLLPNDLLAAKLREYRAHQIEPFPGGQFLEYAEIRGKTDLYFPAVARAGYHWVEVSDNLAPVSTEWKQKMIRTAVEQYNLKVFGEVGKKEGIEADTSLVDDARACLEVGAEIVLLEAAEIVQGDARTREIVEGIVEAVGIDKVMFELPGPWIKGVRSCDVHSMRVDMVTQYGPNVNLGNVATTDVMALEAYRRGLGVNAGSADPDAAG